jgi:CBS domain-containing protein
MRRGVERIDAETSVFEILPRLRRGHVLAVCGAAGFVGLLTASDLIARTSQRLVPTRAVDLLPADTQFCYEDTDAREACELMRRCGIDRLVVLSHDRKPLGVLVGDATGAIRGPEGRVTTAGGPG